MTATRHLRQKTCCVSFFEYIPHEICVFYERQTKNPDFYPTMKDFYILGREDLPFLPEVEHVGYFAARDI